MHLKYILYVAPSWSSFDQGAKEGGHWEGLPRRCAQGSMTIHIHNKQTFHICFRWSRAMPSSPLPPSTWPTTERESEHSHSLWNMSEDLRHSGIEMFWRKILFSIQPHIWPHKESSFESCKTVKKVIPVLLTAALYKMRPGRRYVVKYHLLQNIYLKDAYQCWGHPSPPEGPESGLIQTWTI